MKFSIFCIGVWEVAFKFWFLKSFTWFLGGAEVRVEKSFLIENLKMDIGQFFWFVKQCVKVPFVWICSIWVCTKWVPKLWMLSEKISSSELAWFAPIIAHSNTTFEQNPSCHTMAHQAKIFWPNINKIELNFHCAVHRILSTMPHVLCATWYPLGTRCKSPKSNNFDEKKWAKSEQAKSEQPKSEQPKSEQPKSEQPKSKQPKSEKPKFPQITVSSMELFLLERTSSMGQQSFCLSNPVTLWHKVPQGNSCTRLRVHCIQGLLAVSPQLLLFLFVTMSTGKEHGQ